MGLLCCLLDVSVLSTEMEKVEELEEEPGNPSPIAYFHFSAHIIEGSVS